MAGCGASGLPAWSLARAVNCTVAFGATVIGVGVTAMVVSTGAATFTVHAAGGGGAVGVGDGAQRGVGADRRKGGDGALGGVAAIDAEGGERSGGLAGYCPGVGQRRLTAIVSAEHAQRGGRAGVWSEWDWRSPRVATVGAALA